MAEFLLLALLAGVVVALGTGPLGTLGVGPGYAMAAKLVRPESRVILVYGDGSFGLHEQMRIAGSNLGSTANGNSQDTFAAVVEALAKARRVYILGFGNSAYLAGLAAANLVPYCADAVAVSMEGGNENAAYRLASITAEDALLAISLPRYSLDTLQLARYALERGARVLAITDSPASPLAPIADHSLFATAEHPVLISSNIAVLALIESLVAAVMTRNKEAVRLAAELTESVLSYLHVPNQEPPRRKRPRKRGD